MTFRNQAILVTGGAGAIGSTLVRRLLRLGCTVTIVDDLSSGFRDLIPHDPHVTFIEGSITDDAILERAFAAKPAYVFHLAAHFANQNSVDHPQKDLLVNALGTLKVLEYCVKHAAVLKRFIYASSSCVYGNMEAGGDEESAPIQLDTPYAISKYTGEQYTKFFHELHKVPTVSIRIFNSYGPGEKPGAYRNVVPNFFSLALAHKPLPITGTGEETRSFNFVEDLIDGLLLAAEQTAAIGKTYNIGTDHETKIIDLAHAINALTENPAGMEFKPARSWDTVKRRRSDISKARSELGYAPSTNLHTGLAATHAWFVEHGIR